jgi:hypothetical protein
MLVWINGPFGGGKTATAYELRRRLPGSAVCDPEHVGFGMRRMLPAALRANFQDLPAWRYSVTELLRLTLGAGRSISSATACSDSVPPNSSSTSRPTT